MQSGSYEFLSDEGEQYSQIAAALGEMFTRLSGLCLQATTVAQARRAHPGFWFFHWENDGIKYSSTRNRLLSKQSILKKPAPAAALPFSAQRRHNWILSYRRFQVASWEALRRWNHTPHNFTPNIANAKRDYAFLSSIILQLTKRRGNSLGYSYTIDFIHRPRPTYTSARWLGSKHYP